MGAWLEHGRSPIPDALAIAFEGYCSVFLLFAALLVSMLSFLVVDSFRALKSLALWDFSSFMLDLKGHELKC